MAKPHFRAGVIAVVQRPDDGRVLAFERSDLAGQWQLPQGGIERGETPEQAAWRELVEETGLTRRDVRLVGEHPEWTVYEWPAGTSESNTSGAGRSGSLGQVHRWFFFAPRELPLVPSPDGSELSDWAWMTADELIDRVVEFRRAPYRRVFGG